MLPFLLAGAAIMGAVSLFSGDSSSGGGGGSNEGAVRERHAREKKEGIQNDIDNFSQDAVENIRAKYRANIEIDGETVNVVEKDKRLEHLIHKKKSDNEDLKMIIKQLKGDKNESIR